MNSLSLWTSVLATLTVGAVALLGVFGGMLIQLEREATARAMLVQRAEEADRARLESERQATAWRRSARRWRTMVLSGISPAQAQSTEQTKPAEDTDDPPNVHEADRRAMAARRSRETVSDTRRAVPVLDRQAQPVPQLRDAEDDH